MKNLIPLSKSSTLGIIAPSSFEKNDKILKNLNSFKKLGFNIKLGTHLFDQYGYLAGSDIDRATDLMDMFMDSSVDGIICYRGGFGSSRLIKYLNLELIASNPKIFCGYSDITVLLNLISSKCNFPTFHSPMCNSNLSDPDTKYYFKNILCNNLHSIQLSKFKNIEILNNNDFNGDLCGGNLSMVCSTLGTPYEIDTTNKILLLEDINESPYVIDRLFTQLLASKKLDCCSGLILGHFTDCNCKDSNISFTLSEVITDKLGLLSYPIIKNFPIGHSYPNLTLPIGSQLTYKTHLNEISIDKIFI